MNADWLTVTPVTPRMSPCLGLMPINLRSPGAEFGTKISLYVYADDRTPLIDSVDRNDVGVVHGENNGSDARAARGAHQNCFACQVKSDAGPVVVAGLERTCSFDEGNTAVGPPNQAAVGNG